MTRTFRPDFLASDDTTAVNANQPSETSFLMAWPPPIQIEPELQARSAPQG